MMSKIAPVLCWIISPTVEVMVVVMKSAYFASTMLPIARTLFCVGEVSTLIATAASVGDIKYDSGTASFSSAKSGEGASLHDMMGVGDVSRRYYGDETTDISTFLRTNEVKVGSQIGK